MYMYMYSVKSKEDPNRQWIKRPESRKLRLHLLLHVVHVLCAWEVQLQLHAIQEHYFFFKERGRKQTAKAAADHVDYDGYKVLAKVTMAPSEV